VNWRHGAPESVTRIRQQGFRIAFDTQQVESKDLHLQSFIVQRRHLQTVDDPAGSVQLACWCELQGRVISGNFTPLGDVNGAFAQAGGNVNGAIFVAENVLPGEYRVLLKGDYVRAKGDAVDADHLPPWVGSPNYITGDGIEGGLFESWLTLRA
jgi:hypothetical protein